MHDFKKDVDINRKTASHIVRERRLTLIEVIREINVNYLAVVSLISLFIPHFLKLSVSLVRVSYSQSSDRFDRPKVALPSLSLSPPDSGFCPHPSS
jgi:hypothetical protein